MSVVIDALVVLYERDLAKLKEEISLYHQEENLWKIQGDITNSGGNLCLHLIGNLKTFIGNGLGEAGYIRQRDREFSAKHIARTQMIQEIEETMEIVKDSLRSLSGQDLSQDFPIQIWQHPTDMIYTLIHLHSHLNYHLGQINYHRRVIDKVN